MSQFNWSIFSYIGLIFAIIYRIPQIIKIYKTKKADDLSSFSYLTHNGAYISFILYFIIPEAKIIINNVVIPGM